jgi:hypothetical protein
MEMQIWVKLKAFEPAGGFYHVNLDYVTHMLRGKNFTLIFIAGNGDATVNVEETPEEILALGPSASGQPS